MNIGAFFDIDGTLFRNSLMIEHFKKMIKYEVMDPVIWYGNLRGSYLEWQRRFGVFEAYMDELVDVYVDQLKGINKDYIEFIASQVIKINGDMVYRYTRSRVLDHRAKGHKVFFISGAPDFLVEKMAQKYQVAAFRATEYLVDENNNFTGEVVRMWDSKNKQKAIKALVDEFQVDLDLSYAYGDTTGDLSMLKMVGNPIAINPVDRLFMAIKEDKDLAERVEVIVERKDLIYRLDSNVETLDL